MSYKLNLANSFLDKISSFTEDSTVLTVILQLALRDMIRLIDGGRTVNGVFCPLSASDRAELEAFVRRTAEVVLAVQSVFSTGVGVIRGDLDDLEENGLEQ